MVREMVFEVSDIAVSEWDRRVEVQGLCSAPFLCAVDL